MLPLWQLSLVSLIIPQNAERTLAATSLSKASTSSSTHLPRPTESTNVSFAVVAAASSRKAYDFGSKMTSKLESKFAVNVVLHHAPHQYLYHR